MKKFTTFAALACATFATQAEVRINGFANLTGGITSSDDTFYRYDDEISFREESLLAIQISGDVNDKMTATGQIVARGRDDFDADFEWAYLSYQATDNASVTAGRFRLPLFRFSASLDVGYSYHWVNAPQVVYDVSFNNLDGLRFDYSNYAGDWEYSLQAAVGSYDTSVFGADSRGRNTFVFTGEATYEWFKIRGVYGQTSNTIDLSTADPTTPTFGLGQTLGALTQLGLSNIEDAMQIRDDKGVFVGLGLEVDKFDWFISGEITSIEVEDSYLADDIAYYLTAGLRLGKFTPSVTYENFESDVDVKFLDLVAAAPEAVRTQAEAIVRGVQASQQQEFDIFTVGMRYDYDTNIALKADISRLSDDVNEENDATLMRVSVNYVF